ncbi:MAG: hypothetical protein MK102_15620 [Fuerstiella sp.]|nr:hypothetical protein [Fuerstiella sp.]
MLQLFSFCLVMMQLIGELPDQHSLMNSISLNDEIDVESGISGCIETRDEAGATHPINTDPEYATTAVVR